MELKNPKPLVLSLLTAGVARFFTHRRALSILGDIEEMENEGRRRQKWQIPVFGKHQRRERVRRQYAWVCGITSRIVPEHKQENPSQFSRLYVFNKHCDI